MEEATSAGWSCPSFLLDKSHQVLLSQGEGGRHSRQLLNDHILPRLGLSRTAGLPDAATLSLAGGRWAFTTDAYTVTPLFFPGGDIGSLSIYGTANDLAVSGAKPMWLSLSLILEEGFSLETLGRALDSAAGAAREVGLTIVTGDTKVAPRGAVDRMLVVTSGIGQLGGQSLPGVAAFAPGDALLVTGPLARHGMAVLAAREQLDFSPPIHSDAGSLWPAVEALLAMQVTPRAMRDATRGGVAAVLHEWAEPSGKSLLIEEAALPIGDDVRGACELLGIDPLFVACEGTMVVAVSESDVPRALAALRATPISAGAKVIGQVVPRTAAPVFVRGLMGQVRVLDEPSGALLPRIC